MAGKGRSFAAGVFAAGSAVFAGNIASAQTPPAGAASPPVLSAAELRAQGERASAAGQYEACVDALSAALRIEPDAATAGELGRCEEALGHHVAAYPHLLQALEQEVRASPPAVRDRWKRFHAAMGRVERRIVRVLLLVSPPHADIFLDGAPLGPYLSGRTFGVSPGKHTWVARLPGQPDVVVVQDGRGGDFPDIALFVPGWMPGVFGVLPTSPPAPPPPAPPAPAPAYPVTQVEPCDAADNLPMSVDVCNALRIRWRRMDPTLGLVAGGLLSLGFTPDVGPGFFVGGEAHWRRQGQVEDWGFQVGAEARFVMPTYGGTSRNGELDISITLMELAVAPCVRYKWALGCAVVSPGMTLAGGTLTETPETKDEGPQPLFMLGIGPRLGVDIPVAERFGIRLFGEVRFAPLPPGGYHVNGAYYIWTEPAVSGVLGLAAAYR